MGFSISSALIFHFIPFKSIQKSSAMVQVIEPTTPVGLPLRLNIPSIKVDAEIEYVGLTPTGNMDVPKAPENVGWLQLGNPPGEIGTAVMAGHYGPWKSGQKSVFDDLHKLNKGDQISVEDENGNSIFFVVQEIRNYDAGAEAPEVFSSNDGIAHLNLITCEGTWNKDSKSYSKRLVVFTNKE